MKNVLTSLILCLQLVTSSVAQQPTTRQPQKPDEQKPTTPQETADLDVVKITTNLVQLDAVVTDKDGKQVTDLRADEVEILENGKPRAITNFSYINVSGPINVATASPGKETAPSVPTPPRKLRPEEVQRTIALVVDDLGLSFESAHYARKTLRKFLDEYMQPNDLVAIVRTAGGMGALQSFTSDKRRLYAAIDKVKWEPFGRGRISPFVPISSDGLPHRGANDPDDVTAPSEELTEFRDKMFTVGTLGALNYVIQGLRELPGRKSVILLSDGFFITSPGDVSETELMMARVRTIVDRANRASVVINTLDLRGLQVLGLTADDSVSLMDPQQVLARLSNRRVGFINSQEGLIYLASESGGLSIRNTNDLNAGIRRILADQSGYYLIGYRPDESTFDRLKGRTKYHRISLKIRRPGKYNVRMRSGFFGVTDENIKPVEATPQQQFISALLSPFSSSGIQLRLTSVFANDPLLGSVTRSFLHVKASDLTFTSEPDGSQKAVFDILAMTFGDNGKVVDQFAFVHTLRLKPSLFDKAMKNGFTYDVTVPIKKPGAYQLRTALRDQPSGRIGSATQFIDVPDLNKERLAVSGIVLKGVPLERQIQDQSATAKQTGDDSAQEGDPTASIAVRQFRTGMALVYTFIVYNAKIDKSTGRPQLKTQARLFRNGELIFTGDELPFDPGQQTDLKRFGTGGAIQLGTSMTPGEYVLQIIVTDQLAKDKRRQATQWMDFEIVK
jgi:VWFA-related protein